MKTLLKYSLFFSLITTCLLFSDCKKDTTLSDAEKVAALKNVTLTFAGMSYDIGLPAGSLSGLSFDSLRAQDSATYCNPANYSIAFSVNMNADNTKANAEDARFEGMTIDIIMDTINASPIETVAGAFDIAKNTSAAVTADGTINLATHRLVGLYIFRQIVDGNDLATTLSPILNYKIGVLQGNINVPDIHQDIPTSASPEMKAFLTGLLDSGVFDAK
jgi:hypothetical protein